MGDYKGVAFMDKIIVLAIVFMKVSMVFISFKCHLFSVTHRCFTLKLITNVALKEPCRWKCSMISSPIFKLFINSTEIFCCLNWKHE